MHFENNNIFIHVFEEDNRALVLLKRELFVSDVIDDVRMRLINLNFNGTVIFDEVLLKGVDERFYHVRFQNKVFDLTHFVVMSKPDARLIEFSRGYYRCHPEFLERSNLAKRQQERLLKWINK